jgi:hypothetical protein
VIGNVGNREGCASLPHKLRHKMNNMGDKELVPYGYVGIALKPAELQVSTAWDHDDSTDHSGSGSSDERDSGISINGEGVAEKFLNRQHGALAAFKKGNCPGVEVVSENGSGPQRKRAKKRFVGDDSVLETENVQLKSELARLATEVACLKSFLVKKTPTGTSSGDATHDENSCDSS